MSRVTSLWYLHRALQAVADNDHLACEQAMLGYRAAEVDRLGLKRIILEQGRQATDPEKEERRLLLDKLQEAIRRKCNG